jgi:hypothetical protein
MKKLTICLMTILLLCTTIPTTLKAANNPISLAPNQPVESNKSEVLINRLNEINAMDKSNLSKSKKNNYEKK